MNLMCETTNAFPPPEDVRKVLVFRTAQMAQVTRAFECLRSLYPSAQYSVIGTGLNHEYFREMVKYEILDRWVTPRSYARVRPLVKREDFDIAVLCLNSEHVVGYDRVSEVLADVPARAKLVASYTGRWFFWQHSDFVESGALLRWIVNSLMVLVYPMVAAYLLCKPNKPVYLPDEQRRPAPGYD
ncbi:MAG TPA: hypothetical protein VE398_18675 [Acidobacteriota bacterium]|nr:hypothetical protein [Acidobacteriota bacterium]